MRVLVLCAACAIACSVPQEHFIPLTDGLGDVASDGLAVTTTLSASVDTLAFGDVVMGATSGSKSVTITNTGSQPTGALALSFDDSLGFMFSGDTCSNQVLASSHTCAFSVALMPGSSGLLSTQLRIAATPGGALQIAVSGTGLTPGAVDIVEQGHAFGGVAVDGSPAKHVFIVRNTGQAMIGAPSSSISGIDMTSYTFTDDCTSALGPTDTCNVTVSFHPTAVGARQASLTVTSSMGGGSDTANLAGTGSAHVDVAVTGNGLVTSSQPGINCGTACSADFTSSPVTLSAQATIGTTFQGWGGDCSGTTSCVLDLTGLKTVTADFATTTYALNVVEHGPGTVTSTDNHISCGINCSHVYNYGDTVTLNAIPGGNGAAFAGWSGDCSGNGSCMVTMDQVRNVTATFTTTTYILAVSRSGTGTGTVTASSGAINCGSVCSDAYAENASIVLTAMPAMGSAFTGWTGCTSVNGLTCSVTMVAATSVTATFGVGLYALDITKPLSGTVSSSDGNLACGATCTAAYAFGALVTLNAVPTGAATFTHWIGAPCDGLTMPACTFAMPSSTTTITAAFNNVLTVTPAGNGTGTVASDVGGISCGATCTTTLDQNTNVTLTPTATGGSTFAGWGGDCTGAGACVVAMSQTRNVTATFSNGNQTLTVSTPGNGAGTVTSNPMGINCPGTCTKAFALAQLVTLTATPTGSAVFAGWTGDCTGTSTCMVTMDRARNAIATFSSGTQDLTVHTVGSGSVSSNPASISCPGTCSATVVLGAVITLHATPTGNGTFSGWSGDCTNTTGDCVVTMSQARDVTATFTVATTRLIVLEAGTGSGSVTPAPLGTPCGVRCWDYTSGTAVVLTASADAGSTFSGWSAPCSGTGTCSLPMTADTTETATFVVNFTLTVSLTGDGTGTVSGSGISCTTGSMTGCSATYASTPVTNVTLTASASASPSSVFLGWGGACAGSGTAPTCMVSMTQAQSVTASFARNYVLTTTVMGSGTISQAFSGGSASSCGASCTTYTSGTTVQLTAVPGTGSVFSAWSGDCAGQGTTCTLTMSADHAATATFIALQHLTVETTGGGSVTSTDGTISCGATCAGDYATGATVRLNANPDPSSVFFGWGGACAGALGTTCTVTMSQARDVTATFYYDVNLGTAGSGSIAAATTTPPGIACMPATGYSSCTAYAPNTSVAITETPGTGYSFGGWSGDCSSNGTCSVIASSARAVTATFTINQYAVTVSVTSPTIGQGAVTSNPGTINCGEGAVTPAGMTGNTCMASFDYNSQVTLTATPDPMRERFGKWTSGPCLNSTIPTCTFLIPANAVTVAASFDWFATLNIAMNMAAPPLTTQVVSNVGGINCTDTTMLTGTCSAGFVKGTAVTLTYNGPASGLGTTWSNCNLLKTVVVVGSGACKPGPPSGAPLTSTCSVTLNMPGPVKSEADVSCQ